MLYFLKIILEQIFLTVLHFISQKETYTNQAQFYKNTPSQSLDTRDTPAFA